MNGGDGNQNGVEQGHPAFGVITPQPSPPQKKHVRRWVIVAIVLASIATPAAIAYAQITIADSARKYANHSGNTGWSKNQALSAWKEVEGIEQIEINTHAWKSNPYADGLIGTKQDSGTQGIIELAIKDGYVIESGAGLLDVAAATVWALNDQSIDSVSPVIVYIRGGAPEGYIWSSQGADPRPLKDVMGIRSGFETAPYLPSIPESTPHVLTVPSIEKKFGPHIGNPPIITAEKLVAKGEIPVMFDSIERLRVDYDDVYNSKRCYWIRPTAPQFIQLRPIVTSIRSYAVDYVMRDQGEVIGTGKIDSYAKSTGALTWSQSRVCVPLDYQFSKDAIVELTDARYAEYRPANAAPIQNKQYVLADLLQSE